MKSAIEAIYACLLMYDDLKQKWYTVTASVIQVIHDRAEILGLTESQAPEYLIRVIALLSPPRLVDLADSQIDGSMDEV